MDFWTPNSDQCGTFKRAMYDPTYDRFYDAWAYCFCWGCIVDGCRLTKSKRYTDHILRVISEDGLVWTGEVTPKDWKPMVQYSKRYPDYTHYRVGFHSGDGLWIISTGQLSPRKKLLSPCSQNDGGFMFRDQLLRLDVRRVTPKPPRLTVQPHIFVAVGQPQQVREALQIAALDSRQNFEKISLVRDLAMEPGLVSAWDTY